ncbi:MAG: DUF502 domain-containing protein [Porticoccaceae bacterium]
MKKPLKLVLQGLAAVFPLGLTLYFLIWLLTGIEARSKLLLQWALPDLYYFPGLGILAALVLLMVVGLLVNAYVIRYIIELGERLMESIPLVKSVYGAIEDVMKVFSLADKSEMKTVVSVDMGNDTLLIGFVTGEQAGKRLFSSEGGARVGVYLPMSYQIGGFTVYVPRERLTVLDISIEEAMRLTITGGVQGKDKDE